LTAADIAGFLAAIRRKGARSWLDLIGPYWRGAIILEEKFRDYSMDATNPNNGGKADAFSALGWDVAALASRAAAARDVIAWLRAAVPGDDVKRTTATDEYGIRYTTRTAITGPNGKQAHLIAGWIVDHGAVRPRLITNWLKVHYGGGK
jgi:hypothetical protein